MTHKLIETAMLEQQIEAAFREGWVASSNAEFVGQEAEDWAFSNSRANAFAIDVSQMPAALANAEPASVDYKTLYEHTLQQLKQVMEAVGNLEKKL